MKPTSQNPRTVAAGNKLAAARRRQFLFYEGEEHELKRLDRGPTPLSLFWNKVEAGKLWRVHDVHGKLLGCVRWAFDGWDGYVVTGKKWPEAEKCVKLRPHNDYRKFWKARWSVELAIAESKRVDS